MDDLVAFLLARLDEEQVKAELIQLHLISIHGELAITIPEETQDGTLYRKVHVYDPGQVLQDVAARRRIVGRAAAFAGWDRDTWQGDPPAIQSELYEGVLRDLAAAYSVHPDYRTEWAPGSVAAH